MDKNTTDWRLILLVCSLIVATLMGVRQCFGLFLEPVSIYNNSVKEIFSIAISLQALTWGVSAFLLGILIDRFGPQKALAFGIICSALGIYILVNPENNFFIFTFGIVTGIGLGAGGMSTIVAIIGKTAPPEKKSMAMGLVAAAGSFGMFAFIAPTMFSIQNFGWQSSLLFLSLFTLSLLLLIPLLKKKDAVLLDIKNKKEDFDFKHTILISLLNKNYILLALGFFTCGFHVTFIALHLPNDLVSKGLSLEVSAWALSLIGLFNILGTLFFGWLGNRVLKKNSLAYIYLGRSIVITLFILLPPSPLVALLFGASMGLLWLATIPLTNGVILTFLGPKYLATLGGIVFLSHQSGAILGAWLGGKIFDTFGNYDNAWWVSVFLGITAFIFHVIIQEKPFKLNSKLKTV